MSNEHHQIPTEEELRGIFKVLGEEVPGLLEKLTKILYGVKESEDLARAVEHDVLTRFKQAGLVGLEVYHSDHPPALQQYYRVLADELELLPTGGSDFHGAVKPDTELGTGRAHNLRVPAEFLEGLRRFVQ